MLKKTLHLAGRGYANWLTTFMVDQISGFSVHGHIRVPWELTAPICPVPPHVPKDIECRAFTEYPRIAGVSIAERTGYSSGLRVSHAEITEYSRCPRYPLSKLPSISGISSIDSRVHPSTFRVPPVLTAANSDFFRVTRRTD